LRRRPILYAIIEHRELADQLARKGLPVKTLSCILLIAPLAMPLAAQTQRDVSPKAQERIQKEVRHELVMLPLLSVFDNLAYKVDGYNVTLLGQVRDATVKSDAERAVRRIEGVENVDNQIEVLSASPVDDGLRRRLYRAIYGYPSLQRYALPVLKPIRIIVKGGHVTLEGVVDNQGDKNTAGIRAHIPGVFTVTNNLVVAK
jgi:hyperosmotically inducible protein